MCVLHVLCCICYISFYFVLELVVLWRFCTPSVSNSIRGSDPHQTTVAAHDKVVWKQLQSSFDDGLLWRKGEEISHSMPFSWVNLDYCSHLETQVIEFLFFQPWSPCRWAGHPVNCKLWMKVCQDGDPFATRTRKMRKHFGAAKTNRSYI